MKRVLALLSLFIALALPVATQAGVVLSPDAADSPLVLAGWLDEGTVFTGHLRLTAERDSPEDADTPAISLLVMASDLKTEDGALTIGRQHVSLGGNPILHPGVPQDFQVTVTGITDPGIYHGKLELLPSEQVRAEALIIALEVIARARPSLKPLSSAETLRLNLVNCQHRLSCALAGLVLPESAFLNSWEMQFDNTSAAAGKLVKSAVVALGDKSGFQLSSGQLALPSEMQTFAAREISSLPVTLNRTAMPPDHYTGAVYLMFEGARDMLAVPVDLNVRAGPLGALVAILAGIILGRLVKYMHERGGPQAAKLTELNRIALLLSNAPEEDRRTLEPQLAAVRAKVYRHDLDSVTAELDAIIGRLETLKRLRDMQADLEDTKDEPEARAALSTIDEARRRIRYGQDASELIAEVKSALERLKQGLVAKGIPDLQVEHAVRTVDVAKAAAGKTKRVLASVRPENRVLRGMRDMLFAFSGLSEELRAEATLWIVRPLLYFVLLLGLVAVGLETLYVSKGVTFGATAFTDYLGLILWGLSADVAGRTLSNLQGPRLSGKG
jgi:hypothetical protein